MSNGYYDNYTNEAEEDYYGYYDEEEEGWYQDENGEWYQDPEYASYYDHHQPRSRRQQHHRSPYVSKKRGGSSGYVVQDRNRNKARNNSTGILGKQRRPDNYEEGWYQDESGEWLNEFDWHQVKILFYSIVPKFNEEE